MNTAASSAQQASRQQHRIFRSASRVGLIAVLCAASAGCETNAINHGLNLWQNGNCSGAMAYWLPYAKQGDSAAQNNMGLIWERGCPSAQVPQSFAEAYNWFQLSAQNGHPVAVRNMGVYEENGFRRPVNKDKAAALYSLAARNERVITRCR